MKSAKHWEVVLNSITETRSIWDSDIYEIQKDARNAAISECAGIHMTHPPSEHYECNKEILALLK